MTEDQPAGDDTEDGSERPPESAGSDATDTDSEDPAAEREERDPVEGEGGEGDQAAVGGEETDSDEDKGDEAPPSDSPVAPYEVEAGKPESPPDGDTESHTEAHEAGENGNRSHGTDRPSGTEAGADEQSEGESPGDEEVTSESAEATGPGEEETGEVWEDVGPDDEGEFDEDLTPLERKTGPPEDEEQPLAVHVEEMIHRLAIVVAVAGIVSLAVFPFAERIITFLWYSFLPEGVSKPHLYHPLELLITQLKVASLAGLVVALPVMVYEAYAFMRPGLYPHERRYYLAAVPTSLILAFVGLLFGYFIVLPTVMTYFLYYSRPVAGIAFALGKTFDLILILLGYLALVFQIPLFVMLAIMMGLTTRAWLEDRRLLFWGAFLGLAFLFSPDPTGMAPILVGATMIVLFEGTLMLLRWTGR